MIADNSPDQPLNQLSKESILGLACHKCSAKQGDFLTALLENAGSITKASEITEVNRSQHYRWLGTSEIYRTAFAVILEALSPAIESGVLDMALNGIEEDYYDLDGNKVGTKIRKNEMLAFKLMEANRKQLDAIRARRERDNSAADGGETGQRDHLSDEDIDARIRARLQNQGSDQSGNTVVEPSDSNGSADDQSTNGTG